jgi:LexA-binding, inner membrane-associated putative hydrolase
MNFSTHVMFGIVVGSLFFGKPEIILLMAIGSMIPDLDREYAFLSKESFRRRQVHRAFCHNFVFLGIVYLVNPYLALGAFLHTLLDALTTARDRGVEWLYPFTRLVKRAVYDANGNRLELDPKQKIYFQQNEVFGLTRKTTQDIKPGEQLPWRRTYGPALSGKLLDEGILLGSAALTLLLLLISALGIRQFIDLSFPPLGLSFTLPLIVGAVGGLMNFVGGEVDRKKQANHERLDGTYKAIFFLSIGLIIFAIFLGAIMNPQVATSALSDVPYIATGMALLTVVSFAIVRIRSSGPLPSDDKKEPTIV